MKCIIFKLHNFSNCLFYIYNPKLPKDLMEESVSQIPTQVQKENSISDQGICSLLH